MFKVNVLYNGFDHTIFTLRIWMKADILVSLEMFENINRNNDNNCEHIFFEY